MWWAIRYISENSDNNVVECYGCPRFYKYNMSFKELLLVLQQMIMYYHKSSWRLRFVVRGYMNLYKGGLS